MVSLGDLQQYVLEVCREAFPGSGVVSEFLPILDPALGDLGSDILQRIAEERRMSPSAVAEIIQPKLQASSFGEFQFIDDFLNIRISDSLILSSKISVVAETELGTVLVPPRRRDLDPVGFARVVASASMQWFLAERKGYLNSQAGSLNPGAAWPEYQRWLVSTLSVEPRPEEPNAAEITAMLAGITKFPVTVWLYTDFLKRPRFRAFIQAVREKSAGAFALQCLDRDQTTRITEQLDLAAFQAGDFEEISALVVYLSRQGQGFELDLAVPKYTERSNLRASLRMLADRISRWKDIQSNQNEAATLKDVERLCLVRAKFLPLFVLSAVKFGRVGEFLEGIEQLIKSATRYLNDPEIRMNLDRGSVNSVTAAIIAGVNQSILDIINLCLPFQDLGRARQ